jgi:two-component system, NarL family, nitrate/nitrite response regulator NarL
MDPPATCVLVVADSDVIAARLEAVLRANRRVVTGAPPALGRLVEEHDPAVVVLASTAGRAIGTLEAAAEATPLPPVILLVDDVRAAWTAAARRAGVRAILDHRAEADEIAAALTASLAGLVTLHPEVFRAEARATVAEDTERALTLREVEILEMLAEGLRNQAIARRLRISTYTVKFHVASILDKLGAGSRTEAVTRGVRRGLISL